MLLAPQSMRPTLAAWQDDGFTCPPRPPDRCDNVLPPRGPRSLPGESRMTTLRLAAFLAAGTIIACPAWAQTSPSLDAILQRLDALDRQNAALREELDALRRDMALRTEPTAGGAPAS